MKILILGAGGMLGHCLWRELSSTNEIRATVRDRSHHLPEHSDFPQDHLLEGVDAFRFETVVQALATVQPDVVINCIGIIKQSPLAKDPLPSLQINALFPHQVALACKAAQARMIHFSTDCVFAGTKGAYTEGNISDATDLYGRTKYLGEVTYDHTITLRTSIVGRELKSQQGLLEWFLHQHGAVKGFKKAIFNGLSTDELARVIRHVILPRPDLCGLYQVTSQPISKFDLLELFRDAYQHPVVIEPEYESVIDRSLDSSRFQAATGYQAPSWTEMVRVMAERSQSKPYYS